MPDDEDITADDVRHVAELARVDVSDDEVEQFVSQFADVLEYYEQLSEVPDIDEEPTLHNVMRPDRPSDCLPRDDAARNATTDEDGFFEAPSVQDDS